MDADPMRSFGERILQLMDERGLDEDELNSQLPGFKAYLYLVTHDRLKPNDDFLRRLSSALAADYEELAQLRDTTLTTLERNRKALDDEG